MPVCRRVNTLCRNARNMAARAISKEDESDNLVQRFVRESLFVANVKLKPWIKKYAGYFENQAEFETIDQYKVYKLWLQELEVALGDFWRKEGFDSAEACFKEIEIAVNRDKERHKSAIASLLASLKKSDNRESVCCFLFLPLSSEELVNIVLQLGEYEPFARMMRANAEQLKLHRRAKAQRKQMRGFLNHPKDNKIAVESSKEETQLQKPRFVEVQSRTHKDHVDVDADESDDESPAAQAKDHPKLDDQLQIERNKVHVTRGMSWQS